MSSEESDDPTTEPWVCWQCAGDCEGEHGTSWRLGRASRGATIALHHACVDAYRTSQKEKAETK